MISHDHFFAASILGGRLHVRGIPEWGPWDVRRLKYQPEAYADAGLVQVAGNRKVRTEQELRDAVAARRGVAPARIVWILEGLEEVARLIWKAYGTPVWSCDANTKGG
jgi:hypothetical protein